MDENDVNVASEQGEAPPVPVKLRPRPAPAAPVTDPFAVGALVTGILGLGLIPLVLGIIGLKRTRHQGTGGRGLSLAGIILGALALAAGLAVVTAVLLSVGAWSHTTTTTAGPAGTTYTLHAAGKLSAKQTTATADIVRGRLADTPATVTALGQDITVAFATAPSPQLLTALTAPSTVQIRPVLAIGDPTAQISPAGTPAAPAPTSPSDAAYYLAGPVASAYNALTCTTPAPAGDLPADKAVAVCARDATAKYVLGPVEITGQHLVNVTTRSTPAGHVALNLTLDNDGTTAMASLSNRLYQQIPPTNQAAIVVDGAVELAPAMTTVITAGQLDISGASSEAATYAQAARLGFGHGDQAWTLTAKEP